MAINFRHIKGSALTHAEMDSNLGSYFHSASVSINDASASIITLFRSESNGSTLTQTSASIIIESSSYALTASYADNGGSVDYISSVNLDGSNLRITGSGNAFDGVINLSTISVTSSSYASNASTADSVVSASYASNASTADSVVSASYAATATTASYAENGGGSINTGSLLTTSSATNNVITFTKGDSSTYTVTIATGSGGSTDYISNVSLDTSTLRITGSGNAFDGAIEMNAYTASHAISASYALSASHETVFETSSSHAINADTASYFDLDLTGLNLVSSSGQIDGLGFLATGSLTSSLADAGFLDKTASRIDLGFPTGSSTIDEYLTGSLIDIITGSGIDLISGSGLGDRIVGEGFLLTSSLNDKITGSLGDIITGSGIGIFSGSGQLPIGILSGSGQLPSGLFSGSGQLPGGLLSGSGQIGGLGFLLTGSLSSSLTNLGYLDRTASRLDIDNYLTGSLGSIIGNSALTLFSGSGQLPSGLFSGSGHLPSGLFSGSFGDLAPNNLISGSTQIGDLGFLSGLSSGLISGSGQIGDLGFLNSLGTGLISGAGQLSDLNFLNKTESRNDIDDYLTGSLGSIIGNSSLTLFSGSGQLPTGLFSGSFGDLAPGGLISASGQVDFVGLLNKPGGLISGSGQLPSGLFSGSFGDLAPSGLLSGSGQLNDLNFLNKSDSRLDIDDYLTGSLGSIIGNSALTLFSGSDQVSFTGISSKPSGLVSGSGQVSFTGLGDIPSDIVSGSVIRTLPSDLVSASAQISFTGIGSKPGGLVSGSGQITFGNIGALPADLVSGSVVRTLPSNLVSGSSQVSFTGIGSKPSGLVSGSGQVSFGSISGTPADLVSGSVIRELPANLVSGSSQVSFASIASKPSGLVSGSAQVSFTSIGSKPSGLVSGSGQVSFTGIGSKPSGLVSGSGQVSFTGLSSIPSDIVSGSVVRTLPANLVSGSSQVSFNSIASKPSGLVSGSGQITYSSISSLPTLFDGDYDSLSSKPTLFDGAFTSLSGRPSLISGSGQITFDDIPSLPTFITGSGQISDLGFTGGYTHPNHSGDATSAGDGAITIANDAVTYAKMQNVSATNRILGRDSAGAGNVEEITAASLRTMLNVANGATANTGDITGVTAGDGMSGGATSGAATVTMGTPSSLTAATTNGVTATSHTHAITTTDSGTADTIVVTDTNGEITAANFNTTSDKRLKSNIEPIKEGLEIIKKFVSYEYELNGKQDAGFIAQEVQEVLPYAVHEKSDGYLGMNNKPVLAHLHKAILELDQRLTDIENKIK